MIVIQKCQQIIESLEENILPIYHRIVTLIKKFDSIKFFHVKRVNNQFVDERDNKGENLEQEVIIYDQDDPSISHIL